MAGLACNDALVHTSSCQWKLGLSRLRSLTSLLLQAQ